MKNFKTIITIIAISLSTVFSTSATDLNPRETKDTKTLRTEISSFIGKEIPIEFKNQTNINISFIINNENEIVVLSINSKISELNYFLKTKLNYKKITSKRVKKGEVYIMPITINVK